MNKEKKKYIQLNKKQRGILISHIWGISEKPFWMSRCEYYNSTSTKSKSGMIMVTYSAVYIFRSKMMKGISLRHVFSALRCSLIEQSGDTIIFTIPISVFQSDDNNVLDLQKNDKSKANNKEENDIEAELLSVNDSLNDIDLESNDDESLSSDSNASKKKTKNKKAKKKKKNYKEKYNLPDSDFKLRVDTSHAAQLVYMLIEIMQEVLYGVTNPRIISNKPKIKLDIQKPKRLTEKPIHSLELRALFLSHYDRNQGANRIYHTGKNEELDEKLFSIIYNAKSRVQKDDDNKLIEKLKTGLDSCDYFTSNWDGNPVLTIGKEFHPTIFGHAFGRAVGWETSLTTVVFRSANFSRFSDFLRSLVSYSETIEKIVFLDYERGKSLNFNLSLFKDDSFKENDTTIKKWWFLNTSIHVIDSFFKSAGQLTKPFDELVISRYSYSKVDIKRIFFQIQTIPLLHSCQTIKLISLKFQEFPYFSFKLMCSTFQCLTVLYLKNMVNCDGNLLLTSLFEANPRIHQISLIKIRFESNMKQQLYLPKGLVFLDVSKSQFINTSFVSFLSGITSRPVNRPFILNARKLKIGNDEFNYIKTIDLSRCKANLYEVNLSHNHIPTTDEVNIFTFLSTQKKLKQIVLFDVTTDDQANFAKSVIELCHATTVEGLDIGVHFERAIIQTFLSLLSRCENLTRLSINNCGAGNDGLVVLCSLFNLLGQLREFACDGFRPKPLSEEEIKHSKSGIHPLIELWKKIGESKLIERNDWPKQDLVTAELDLTPKNRKDEIWINALKSRKPPKTQQERIQDTIDELKLEEESKREIEFRKSKRLNRKSRFFMGHIGDDYDDDDNDDDEGYVDEDDEIEADEEEEEEEEEEFEMID